MTEDDDLPENTLDVPTGTEYGFGVALENCCQNALEACPMSDPPTEQEIQQMVGWVYAKSNRRTSPRMAEKCLRAIIEEQRDDGPEGAYLFGNGNALFFDTRGEQFQELQSLGISGVHEYVERFPSATVYWATWGESDGARSAIHPNVLDYIRRPDELDRDE